MGHCDWTAFGYLFLETRNDGAVGTEDVAEAGRHELGLALTFATFYREAEGLDVDFCQSLGATHYVCRVYGLVGRNHHHLFHVVFEAFVGHVTGTAYVHQHCFAWVLFHKRNMLVSCRVEHYLRVIFPEHVVETFLQTYVTDDRCKFQIRESVFEFETEVMHRGLGIVEEHEFLNAECRELAAEF